MGLPMPARCVLIWCVRPPTSLRKAAACIQCLEASAGELIAAWALPATVALTCEGLDAQKRENRAGMGSIDVFGQAKGILGCFQQPQALSDTFLQMRGHELVLRSSLPLPALPAQAHHTKRVHVTEQVGRPPPCHDSPTQLSSVLLLVTSPSRGWR